MINIASVVPFPSQNQTACHLSLSAVWFYVQLDAGIVLNEHNTVLDSKHLAICATVYVGIQK